MQVRKYESLSFAWGFGGLIQKRFSNLKLAIMSNFPRVNMPKANCILCKSGIRWPSIHWGRALQIFLIKKYHFLKNNYVRYQSYNTTKWVSRITKRDLPIKLEFGTKVYALFGVILFHSPLIQGDSGHYVAAVKLNKTWQVFDDLKSKTYNIKKTEKVVVHFLFYILKK